MHIGDNTDTGRIQKTLCKYGYLHYHRGQFKRIFRIQGTECLERMATMSHGIRNCVCLCDAVPCRIVGVRRSCPIQFSICRYMPFALHSRTEVLFTFNMHRHL